MKQPARTEESGGSSRPLRIGLIGWPVAHSLSPKIQTAAFRALGMEHARYELLPVSKESFESRWAEIEQQFDGANVTVPHKVRAAQKCATLRPDAARTGAVNTLIFDSGSTVGDNTDVEGLRRAFDDAFGRAVWVDARVVIVGAGGASRAALAVAASSGAKELVVVSRRDPRQEDPWWLEEPRRTDDYETLSEATREAPRTMTSRSTGPTLSWSPWGQRDAAVESADVIVHATPIGRDDSDCPLDPRRVRRETRVYDMNYTVAGTGLSTALRNLGHRRIATGEEMLVHQAALSFLAWTGRSAPIEDMRAAFDRTR